MNDAQHHHIGSLFSGYGGLDMAAEAVFGGTTVWHSEVDRHASKVLALRWPGVPNLGDITAIDWSTVEPVDVLCGGFPCQDISSAGRGAGIKEGTRGGLWYRYADAVRVLRPRFVFVENVGALVVRGLDIVLGDLAALGYDTEWTCLRASDIGAPHRRERLFILAWAADAESVGWEGARLRGRPAVGGGVPAADAPHLGHERDGSARDRRAGSADRGGPAADADIPGGEAWGIGPGGGDARRLHVDGGRQAWGPYAAAITRWERTIGRPAPSPTDDRGRLNTPFAEWMMGLPAGWVTGPDVAALDVPRSAMLRMIGNGVVPQQGEAAGRILLARATAPWAVAA